MSQPASLPGLGPDYTSQFFHGDFVVRRGDEEEEQYVVLRCWAEDDLPAQAPGAAEDDVNRPLLRGEVGISSMDKDDRLIVPESSLILWTRDFYLGDTVKLSLASAESARVIETRQEVKVNHIGGDVYDQWIPANRLIPTTHFQKGSRVAYKNWIGTVEGVLLLGMIRTDCGKFCKVLDPFGIATVGDPYDEVLKRFELRGIHPLVEKCECGLPEDALFDYVAVTAVRIMWNAINQKLSAAEQKDWPQPQDYFKGSEMLDLQRHLHGPEVMFPMDFACYFRDKEDYKRYNITPTVHEPRGLVDYALTTTRTKIMLKLQWQDGTTTVSSSLDVVPYSPMIYTDSWPGDHVLWSDEDGKKRAAVVQNWNVRQRTLDLLFPDTQETQSISALELDDATTEPCGIRINTEVLLCDDNATPAPHVPTIGQNQPIAEPTAIMTYMDDTHRSNDPKYEAQEKEFLEQWSLPVPDCSDIDWHGQVKSLLPDGRIEVRLASGAVVKVELKNLYKVLPPPINKLLDPNQDGDEAEDDGGFMMGGPGAMMFGMGPMGPIISFSGAGGGFGGGMSMGMGPFDPINFFGGPPPDDASDRSWETTDDEDWSSNGSDDQGMDVDDDGNGKKDEEDEVDDDDREIPPSKRAKADTAKKAEEDETTDQDAMDIEEVNIQLGTSSPSPISGPSKSKVLDPEPSAGPSTNGHSGDTDGEGWVSFDICETAPSDHHFYGRSPAESSGTRMARLNKEHKALKNSLPENILVRTYEDRTDLLRVLILGPEGTPYAGAPFVFDVFLHSSFPHQAPKVHFHSHTNGKGRCNPNLYEDGKVCLSILGTWEGDASESWHPSKSSLLQVFVSISGLVLVRHPYHCEPAFAKLEGTKEGLINSRQYSEKAYVLSRSFVRQALLHPPGSLEKELEQIYLENGRLQSVISHAKRLMDKEDDQGEEDEGADRWDADAIGSLSIGAKISLKRTLEALEKIQTEHKMPSA